MQLLILFLFQIENDNIISTTNIFDLLRNCKRGFFKIKNRLFLYWLQYCSVQRDSLYTVASNLFVKSDKLYTREIM
jgi:hypothetical protein